MNVVEKAIEIITISREEAKRQASSTRETIAKQQEEVRKLKKARFWMLTKHIKRFILQRRIRQTKEARKRALREIGIHIGTQMKLQKGDYKPAVKLLRQIERQLRFQTSLEHRRKDVARLDNAADYVYRVADRLEKASNNQ